MVGKILSVDAENQTLVVVIEMFGRETNVDLTFSQVHKIN